MLVLTELFKRSKIYQNKFQLEVIQIVPGILFLSTGNFAPKTLRRIKMKKAIISAIVIALFALLMSLQAGPEKEDASKEEAIKPLSTMKATATSPSSAPAEEDQAGDQDKKSDTTEADKDAEQDKDAEKK